MMAAVVNLIPYDDRGHEIISELEDSPQEEPIKIRHYGPLEYYVRAESVRLRRLDTMLDRIDPEWRDHLGRAS
jgi:hypothetical protein